MRLFFIIIFASVIALISIDCGEVKEEGLSEVDSLKIELQKEIDSLQREADRKVMTYSFYEGKFNSNSLIEKYGEEGLNIILALNRVDAKNLRRVDSLLVPDTVVSDFRLYSPFPFEIPEAYDVEKLLLLSQRIQAFAAYEYGTLVRWGPSSTGKRSTPTPNGLFHTNWKGKEVISTIDEEWLLKWNFNILNFEGISLHQYEMPGYPASHSCARLFAADAEWFYYWAEQWITTPDGESVAAYGTPVILYGGYDFNNPRIWKRLADEPGTAKVSRSEISELMAQYLNKIIVRQEQRQIIIAQRDSLEKAKEEAASKE